MSGGGSGGGTNTVQKSDPWSGQQPYLTGSGGNPGLFPEAANLYSNNPLEFYPGQTYAGMAPETEMALSAQSNRAINGSPINAAAQGELTNTLSGQYLDASQNPYLMPMADNILAKVLPGINSRFAQSGRGVSGLGARAAAEGATDALGTQAFNNYNAERTRQMQAMMFAPEMANQDYTDFQKLQEVGNVREDLQQQGINEDMQRYQFQNMEPYQRLGLYNQLIQGNYGGQTTTAQTQPRRSIGAGAVGGAALGGAAGYAAQNALGFSSPWQSAALGAGAGGLAGGLLL